MYAVDLKQEGKTYNEIVNLLYKKRNMTRVFLVPDDLTYLVKGGRAPAKVKTIANIFRLRPILGTKKGKLRVRGVLYGKTRTADKFVNFLKSKIDSNKQYRIMVAHSNCQEKGQYFLDKLISENSNIVKHNLLELGGALGAHAGPNSIVVGLQEI